MQSMKEKGILRLISLYFLTFEAVSRSQLVLQFPVQSPEQQSLEQSS